MFDEQVESEKRIKLLYDEALPFDKQIIKSLTRKYVSRGLTRGANVA
jgi:hypothetical protein